MKDRMEKKMFTTREAVIYLGLAKSCLEAWRCRGDNGPTFVKMGKAVRYRKEDLDMFIEMGLRTSTV